MKRSQKPLRDRKAVAPIKADQLARVVAAADGTYQAEAGD